MKKRIIIPIILTVIVILAVFLPKAFQNYKVNTPDNDKNLEVPGPMRLYSGDNLGYSFLYPSQLKAGKEDGSACIYATESLSVPYVLVDRTEKKNISPEKYFDKCNGMMIDTFDKVSSTPIQEVKVGDKTLYLTRYEAEKDSKKLVIDRYLEIYPKFYIEYTSVSDSPGSLNTEVYYAISTLRVNEGAYSGAFSKKTTRYKDDDTGISIDLPDMLTTHELTIGTFSANENAVLLSIICKEDNEKNPIYNRQDFIDRARDDNTFAASFLGADFVKFSDGKELTLDGRSFYFYPMEMVISDQTYQGVMGLANSDETGVVVLCYGVRDCCAEHDKLTQLCESCIESVKIK